MAGKGKFAALAALKNREKANTNGTVQLRGKRSNPDYRQICVLIKKATHRNATTVLRDRDDGTDFGDLVQSLLEKWLIETESAR